MASPFRIASFRKIYASNNLRHQRPMISSRLYPALIHRPQQLLQPHHRALSTTQNAARTRRLFESFNRTLQESWSVLQVTVPKPGEWKASCLTLTQQEDNRVARSLLHLDKEIHLLQYHGPRKYFMEHQAQLLPSSWTTYFSRNVLEDDKASATRSASPTDSSSQASQSSPNSTSSSTVAKVPFVMTTAMKQSLLEMGYEMAQTKRMTPLDAHLLLQHQVAPQDMPKQLPILLANHQTAQQKLQQQQQQSTVISPTISNEENAQAVNDKLSSNQQEAPDVSTTLDESTSDAPILQIAATHDKSETTSAQSASIDKNNMSSSSESEAPSPEEEIPVQTSIATTTGASVESTGKLEWYRVVEVVLPEEESTLNNEGNKSDPKLYPQAEERIVVGLHRTLEQAQQDCALRQELAERTDVTTHRESQPRRTYEIQVPRPTLSNNATPADQKISPATTITKRHFSSKKSSEALGASDESWIPPSRPLLGDQSTTPAPLEEDVVENEEGVPFPDKDARKQAATVDWMQTRRSMLMGGTPEAILQSASESMLEDEDEDDGNIIPILEHQLLTRFEIAEVLEFGGGERIMTVLDDPENPTFGGAKGNMVVTAPTNRHMVQMADQLVRQMRYRKLQEVGVVGAQRGPEGNKKDPHEHWMVVNCENYVVHILLEESRNHLQLEKLWSGEDPIWTVDDSQESWDAYIQANPAPENFGAPVNPWDLQERQLQKNRFTAHHRPIEKKKKKNSRRGSRRRRQ